MNLFKKLFPLVALFLAACGASAEELAPDNRLDVVTTFYPMYDFTQKIVGDNGKVTLLLGAGQETHSYEPTPKDMAAIAEADVFVYNSKYMEIWVPDVLENLVDSDVKIIDASEGIPFFEEKIEEGSHDNEGEDQTEGKEDNHAIDPHIWLDPVYAKQMVETISTGIQMVDKGNTTSYQANTKEYVGKLEDLDQEFQTAFQDAESRYFIVQHAAFGYLARRYGLEEVAISTLTSNQEVSPAKLAEVGKFINENNVEVIYYQDSANNDLAKTLANETGIELGSLSAIEGVTIENQEAGMDYVMIMRDNLEALKQSIN